MAGRIGQAVVAALSILVIVNFFCFGVEAHTRPCSGPGGVCGGFPGIACCNQTFYCYIAPSDPPIADDQGKCVPKCEIVHPPNPNPTPTPDTTTTTSTSTEIPISTSPTTTTVIPPVAPPTGVTVTPIEPSTSV